MKNDLLQRTIHLRASRRIQDLRKIGATEAGVCSATEMGYYAATEAGGGQKAGMP